MASGYGKIRWCHLSWLSWGFSHCLPQHQTKTQERWHRLVSRQWTENCQVQKLVINGKKSSLRPITSSTSPLLDLGLMLNIFICVLNDYILGQICTYHKTGRNDKYSRRLCCHTDARGRESLKGNSQFNKEKSQVLHIRSYDRCGDQVDGKELGKKWHGCYGAWARIISMPLLHGQ